MPMSTGKWAVIRCGDEPESVGIRMLHEDRRGRLVVRWMRDWWVVEKNSEIRFRKSYVIVGRA